MARLNQWRDRLPRLLLELLVLLAVVLVAEWWLTRGMPHDTAPPFAADMVRGEHFSLERLAGRPSLVYFWADWCPVCRLQSPTVAALGDEYPLISVAAWSGDKRKVASYLAEHGWPLPAIADPDGVIAARYRVQGVPAVFVLDTDGRVFSVTRGYTTALGLRLRLWLAGW